MNAAILEPLAVLEQLRSLTALVQQLRQEVGELRQENAGLRRRVSELASAGNEVLTDGSLP